MLALDTDAGLLALTSSRGDERSDGGSAADARAAQLDRVLPPNGSRSGIRRSRSPNGDIQPAPLTIEPRVAEQLAAAAACPGTGAALVVSALPIVRIHGTLPGGR